MDFLDVAYIVKIKKLLAVIGKSAPLIPNVTELASSIQIARQTLLQYFEYLEESKLIYQVFKQSRGLGVLEKPDKIFLENSNLLYALATTPVKIGTARECFAVNQLSYQHTVEYGKQQGDFKVDGKWTFEVGGEGKTFDQIADLPNSFVLADDIESPHGNKLPLWMVGMMY